ncbi:hypothetical protein Cantr_01803 [Candida viswanathii]|uniref:Uncharacterized protein n=1 Tax=Candida viswanathii TaxID=5486 RepID=A0A367YJJ0_9ASCO|nr:hypothetical protein Cantr_01803 [Candida viswanathii]
MRYLQSFVWLIVFQLSLVLGRSNRHLRLTYNSNGACIAINQTLPNTQLTLDFYDVNKDQIPLVISEYVDLFKFRNLPNFNDFANYTYLEDKPFLKANDKTKQVTFDLSLRKSFLIPERFYNKTITEDQTVVYKVTEPGVYCIYLPLYSYDDIRTHPLNYYVDVTVENEALSPNVLNELSTQVNLLILFGSVVLLLTYLYPGIRTGGMSKLPPVLNKLFPFLAANLVYRLGFLGLWVFYFFYPSDSIYNYIQNYYDHVQPVLFDKWFQYVVGSVYLGTGILNLPVKPSEFWLKLIFAASVATALVRTYALSDILHISDVFINDVPYGIVDKSILVNRAYKFTLTDFYSDTVKYALLISKQVQTGLEIAIQVLSLIYGVRIFWYLRTKNPRLSRVLLQSVLVHLIAWSYFGKYTIVMLYVNLRFSGVFDVGELLGVVGNVIEVFDLKVSALQVFEVLLLWVIWTTKKPYNVDEVEQKEDKKKRH